MIYIKLDDDMNLIVTQNEPIYRGDNLNQKIIYLIPEMIGEIDALNATLFLCYVRADNVADIVTLERMDGKYNDAYYQYALPVTCRMSKCAGSVCSWLSIMSGSVNNPRIAKSGECVLVVEESKNMDDYICDHQLSAIYALQKQVAETDASVDALDDALGQKGDTLCYDTDKQTLQLMSEGKPVGEAIDMSKMVNEDETIYFDKQDEELAGDPDAVIYFN